MVMMTMYENDLYTLLCQPHRTGAQEHFLTGGIGKKVITGKPRFRSPKRMEYSGDLQQLSSLDSLPVIPAPRSSSI